MLIPLRRLVAGMPSRMIDRIRQPPERSRALALLRQRLGDARAGAKRATPAEVEAAGRMRELKLELAEGLDAVTACGQCTRAFVGREGTFDGGLCCSGETTDVFTDAEVAALALAGTASGNLVAPRTELAGCAFRGATGCTLGAAHRPAVCARYLCGELRAELAARGDLLVLDAAAEELTAATDEHALARKQRLEAERLAELHAAFGLPSH